MLLEPAMETLLEIPGLVAIWGWFHFPGFSLVFEGLPVLLIM